MMRALHLLSVQQDVPSRVMTEDEKVEAVADAVEEEADVAAAEPEEDSTQPVEVGLMVPNYRGKSLKQVIQMARESRMPVDYIGTGVARRQNPKAGSRLKPGERIRVEFAR
jgi:hypothetical protein